MLSAAIEGMFLNTELFGHQRGASNKGYKKINYGTLVLSTQNLHLGNANVNLRFDHGMVSPAYKTYRIRNCAVKFLAEWIKSEKAKQFFYDATTVGASVCRRNVEWETLYDQTLYLPAINEQQHIAEFLSLVSERICRQEKFIENLKKYKRGVLQNLFTPKEGKWYKQKFGDFFTEQTERTSETDRFPICSLTVEEGVILKPERYFREFLITKEGDSYKILKNGWFAYNPMNAHIGAIAPNRTGLDVCVSGYYNIFTVKNASTTAFWEEFLKCYNMLCYYKVIATGSLIEKQRVHYSQFVDIELPLPSIEEQNKMASLIEVLNKKIRNAEFTLNHLQKLKIGVMQKMFV